MLEEAPGQGVDQVLRDPTIAGHALQHRPDLGHGLDRTDHGQARGQVEAPGDKPTAALPDRPPHPAGRRQHRPEIAANGTYPSHSPGRTAAIMGRSRVSAMSSSSPGRSDNTRPLAAFGASKFPLDQRQLGGGRRPRKQPATKRRGHQPGIEVTTRQAGHLADRLGGRRTRRGSGNAGPANATGLTRPTSPGTRRKVPVRTGRFASPSRGSSCSTPRGLTGRGTMELLGVRTA